jgi:hypothetical protein
VMDIRGVTEKRGGIQSKLMKWKNGWTTMCDGRIEGRRKSWGGKSEKKRRQNIDRKHASENGVTRFLVRVCVYYGRRDFPISPWRWCIASIFPSLVVSPRVVYTSYTFLFADRSISITRYI